LAFLVAASVAAPAFAGGNAGTQAKSLEAHLTRWRAAHGPTWTMQADAQTGYVEMLYGGMTPVGAAATDAEFEPLARTALAMTADLHGVDADTLVHHGTQFLPLGQIGSTDKETVRFREEIGGVRVVGGWVNVLFSADGSLLSVQSTALPRLSGFDTTPTLTERAASAIAAATFDSRTACPRRSSRRPSSSSTRS
jgi:hypothetical protein